MNLAPARARYCPRGGYEEYHPYGSTAWWAGSSGLVSQKRYRFTGMERDDETGLQCHGVRYCAVWLGRWVSADPIGLGDGVNRYLYAAGRPSGVTDISGLGSDPEEQWVEDLPPAEEQGRVTEEPLEGVTPTQPEFYGEGYLYDPSKAPKDSEKAPWSVTGVRAALGQEGSQLLDDALAKGARVVTYSRVSLVWVDPSGKRSVEEERGLGHINFKKGHEGDLKGAIIYIPRDASNAEAAGLLVHELSHPKLQSESVEKEEVDVRVATEEFLLRNNLPPSFGLSAYRAQDPSGRVHANPEFIRAHVHSDPAYSRQSVNVQRDSQGRPSVSVFVGLRFRGVRQVDFTGPR